MTHTSTDTRNKSDSSVLSYIPPIVYEDVLTE